MTVSVGAISHANWYQFMYVLCIATCFYLDHKYSRQKSGQSVEDSLLIQRYEIQKLKYVA